MVISIGIVAACLCLISLAFLKLYSLCLPGGATQPAPPPTQKETEPSIMLTESLQCLHEQVEFLRIAKHHYTVAIKAGIPLSLLTIRAGQRPEEVTSVATLLHRHCGPADAMCYEAGGCFSLLLPTCSNTAAWCKAQAILAETPFANSPARQGAPCFTISVASLDPAHPISFTALLQAAGSALPVSTCTAAAHSPIRND